MGNPDNRVHRMMLLSARADAVLQEFEDRVRDGGGRYATGAQAPKAEDYAAAHLKKKKRAVVGAGLGLAAAGAVGSRKGLSRIGQGAVRAMVR